MDWLSNKDSWPNTEHSDFFRAEDVRLHFQRMGKPGSPKLLLLHGSGATTHSFRDLLPLLADHFDVLAPDLPGHGFSSAFSRRVPALDTVCGAMRELMVSETFEPVCLAGHSAGAAVAARLISRSDTFGNAPLVSINGAFFPFPGLAQYLFPVAARMLFLNPVATRLFAYGASSRVRVEDLLSSTGSMLNASGIDLYQRALSSRRHIEGTLEMMSHWDLNTMEEELAALPGPVLQVIGMMDGTISPKAAERVGRILQAGEIVRFEEAGHLVHEERPEEVAAAIKSFFDAAGSHTEPSAPTDSDAASV
ncbi:MAG: alpha/beta fold hydrolase BchO [Pseudomonadota bacterium]